MFSKHLILIIQEKLVKILLLKRTYTKDYLLDFVEFLIAISVTSHGDIREKLNMAFNMYDIDKNGKVDSKEMEQIVTV
jgi:Ca2+-binding EF-hand superfamily protein